MPSPAKDEKKVEIGFKDGLPQYAASPLGQAVAFDGKLSFDAGKAANVRLSRPRARLQRPVCNFSLVLS